MDLVVVGGDRKIVALHEFGHALGLGDEYAYSDGSNPLGADAKHHPSAAEMTDAAGRYLPGAAVEHNGSVMSFGDEIREQHYAIFYKALEQVTDEPEWAVGAPKLRADATAACAAAGASPAGADAGVDAR